MKRTFFGSRINNLKKEETLTNFLPLFSDFELNVGLFARIFYNLSSSNFCETSCA